MKPHYSKQILPVPWPSLYRGSIVAGGNAQSSQGNPLNDSPAGQYKTFYSCWCGVFERDLATKVQKRYTLIPLSWAKNVNVNNSKCQQHPTNVVMPCMSLELTQAGYWWWVRNHMKKWTYAVRRSTISSFLWSVTSKDSWRKGENQDKKQLLKQDKYNTEKTWACLLMLTFRS